MCAHSVRDMANRQSREQPVAMPNGQFGILELMFHAMTETQRHLIKIIGRRPWLVYRV